MMFNDPYFDENLKVNIQKCLSYTCGKVFESIFKIEKRGNRSIYTKAMDIIEEMTRYNEFDDN